MEFIPIKTRGFLQITEMKTAGKYSLELSDVEAGSPRGS